MPDGHEIVFDGQSDEHPDHSAGNVIFKVKTAKHPKFTREGDDLRYQATISLVEALTGYAITIHHLDGHVVTLESKDVTIPGQVRTVPGEGMPQHENQSVKGNLHVEFTVSFPPSLTEEQKEAVKKIFLE
eukprot:TRINITY_DN7123_c1_g2_i2.p1 TRINITY_DN7123_c1_g2~~TRINITY_DN7123_c1_g2_i2.p1  ORF type:complete len:130 (-),score=37.60 TRINITY_DN7123_c1_g2_i2:108-497(-)